MINYIETIDMQLDLFSDDVFISLIEADLREPNGVIWEGFEL